MFWEGFAEPLVFDLDDPDEGDITHGDTVAPVENDEIPAWY